MKKFLPALLFVADLYGMIFPQLPSIKGSLEYSKKEQIAPRKVWNQIKEQLQKGLIQEQLTPNVVVSLKNPQEEQVSAMYNTWQEMKQQASKAAWNYFYERKERDTNQNDQIYELESYKKWLEQVSKMTEPALDEVNLISRPPKPEEQEAVEKVKNALKLSDISEVRIIDAESYIRGIYLSDSDRQFFLNWLHDADHAKDAALFDKYLSKFNFPNQFMNENHELEIKDLNSSNEGLKQKIQEMIAKSSLESKTYRELMICFFARASSIQSVCSRLAYGKCLNEIFEGEMSCYSPAGIALRSNGEGRSERTFIESSQVFFHECGHSLDLFSAKFDSDKANETMSTIAPKFFNFSVYESLCSFLKMQIEKDPSFLAELQKTFGKIKSIDDFDKRLCSFLKMQIKKDPSFLAKLQKTFGKIKSIDDFDKRLCSFLKMQIEKDPSFLAKLQKTFGKIKSIDDFIACVKSNVDVFLASFLMESSAEVWQIFGVALLTNGYISYLEETVHTSTEDITSLRLEKPINRRILLLSRMNDWPLSLDLNCLIRGDHLGAEATLPFFHYQLPTEVYDALMNFHGTSWEKYKQKVSSTVSKKDEENAN
ncbi:MAG: hypothetical protein IJA14_00065 [Alphaproteobacteria bacterium]|nr:hypothetical protein [Alphaproteobacteria bacterium]